MLLHGRMRQIDKNRHANNIPKSLVAFHYPQRTTDECESLHGDV